MKNKKYIYLIVSLLCLTTAGSFLYTNYHKKIQPEVVTVSKQESTPLVKALSNETQKSVNKITTSTKPELKNSEIVKNTEVTLSVLGNTYTTNVESGATVYDAMLSIENTKENNFSFVSDNYSGLGYFINEINGVKGSPGKYWIYYVNNKKASVGVSKYILKAGDVISWKQESM